jgi:hypothetical protein
MWVVRWNHSGDPATNPEQHNPVELDAIPRVDPSTGGLRAGVAEDFPNGGGNRGFLFSVDGPAGRFSWFYQNSASVTDLHVPIVIDGKDYGAPIENLKAAMTDAGLPSVDLWIGTGGTSVAQLALPILKPKAYLPVHWDGLWGAFQAGVTTPYSDPALETLLSRSGVTLLKPLQYMDKWRLDREGVRPVANAAIKRALGFAGGSAPQAREPAVLGLDHIPVAVADLERAAERYRALGFVLKSGVAHDNGIRNQHAKFADGTEVELITAPEARDALTTTYRQHLAAGDGPAFVAFYAPVMDRVAERLTALKRLFTRDGGYLDLPDTDVLRYIFFGPRNSSPTDRPEHFVHPNTAESLIAVWLAGDDLSQERAALKELGATESYDEVHVLWLTSGRAMSSSCPARTRRCLAGK